MSESLPEGAESASSDAAEQGAAPVAAVGRDRLRERARAAVAADAEQGGWQGGPERNPATVLALLDEIDRLRVAAGQMGSLLVVEGIADRDDAEEHASNLGYLAEFKAAWMPDATESPPRYSNGACDDCAPSFGCFAAPATCRKR